jgi:Staphylococcal nuclease homologue
LTRFADTYGRSIAFVFKGKAPRADGSDVYLDKSLLHQSANYHLLVEGLAYPTFYSKLYVDLRQEMVKSVEKARHDKKGIWQLDQTTDGFVLEKLQTITDKVAILPKLFRRLLDYLAINERSVSLTGFKGYLKSLDDRPIILPDGQFTNFDYVVDVKDQTIKLTHPPERLVFVEK